MNNRKISILFILFSGLLGACGLFHRRDTVTIDVDRYHDTIQDNPTVIKGETHTGSYVCKIDSAAPYSIGLKKSIKDLNVGSLKTVEIKCWAKYLDPTASAVLVISIEANGQSLLWNGINVQDLIKPGDWAECKAVFDIPEGKGDDGVLSVYVWNNGKLPVLVDDLAITYE